MGTKGDLYLIPSTLGDSDPEDVIPQKVKNVIQNISNYIVENERSARRYLIKIGIKTPIDDLRFFVLNKHTPSKDIVEFLSPALNGLSIGLISEAGVPAVADPGAVIVNLAHQKNIKVVPLSGPSSILLALMGSGMNGQKFSFSGYLPKERKDRKTTLRRLEDAMMRSGETQLFMDTPFRNTQVLEDLLEVLRPATHLCIACDLTLESEFIVTKAIKQWKEKIPEINKRPCIFAIGAVVQ